MEGWGDSRMYEYKGYISWPMLMCLLISIISLLISFKINFMELFPFALFGVGMSWKSFNRKWGRDNGKTEEEEMEVEQDYLMSIAFAFCCILMLIIKKIRG